MAIKIRQIFENSHAVTVVAKYNVNKSAQKNNAGV